MSVERETPCLALSEACPVALVQRCRRFSGRLSVRPGNTMTALLQLRNDPRFHFASRTITSLCHSISLFSSLLSKRFYPTQFNLWLSSIMLCQMEGGCCLVGLGRRLDVVLWVVREQWCEVSTVLSKLLLCRVMGHWSPSEAKPSKRKSRDSLPARKPCRFARFDICSG